MHVAETAFQPVTLEQRTSTGETVNHIDDLDRALGRIPSCKPDLHPTRAPGKHAQDGGYRVSGRWSYGSFIGYSQWVLGNCLVHDEDVPRRDAFPVGFSEPTRIDRPDPKTSRNSGNVEGAVGEAEGLQRSALSTKIPPSDNAR
jgi:hypothetical protein